MKLKTLTWNIGGGKLLEPGKDPLSMTSYTKEGLEYIVAKLKNFDPDIITLQEVQGSKNTNQIAFIADRLGLRYFFYDHTSMSHIDVDQTLGNGIISKYPVSKHKKGLFENPNITFDLENKTVKSHDKGYGHCVININGYKIRTASIHLLPFRKIGIELDSDIAHRIFKSVANELKFKDDYILLQGDFNINDTKVGQYFGELLSGSGLSETTLKRPTTPKGYTYDHILHKGMVVKDIAVDSTVKTDHYPVMYTFEILE